MKLPFNVTNPGTFYAALINCVQAESDIQLDMLSNILGMASK